MPPRVLILRAPGTNCDEETAFAFERAGAVAERVHVNRLLESPRMVDDYQILCIPGGFSYGDDVGAGRILGNQIRHHLADMIHSFRDAGKLILGVCNGFQVLLKSGVLLEENGNGPAATLAWNASGRFQDRWVELGTTARDGDRACVFLAGIERMYLPIAHAEGKFVTRDRATLDRLNENGQFVLRYRRADAPLGEELQSVVPFPANPNGAEANVAGVCDTTGRVLGLMPHPERHIDPTHHPRWTRRTTQPEAGDGLKLFQNALRYFL